MQSVYIAGTGPGSGKATVVLGMMDILGAVNRKVGFFRPVTHDPDTTDPLTALVRERAQIDLDPRAHFGCSAAFAHERVAAGRSGEVHELIIERFKQVESEHDLVVCVGTDFDGPFPSLEFEFNLDVARNLGCTVMPVVPGFGSTTAHILDSVRLAGRSIMERGVPVLATFVNGVRPELLEEARQGTRERMVGLGRALGKEPPPVYLLPRVPTLEQPTVEEIRSQLDAELLPGFDMNLEQDVAHRLVAAMQVPNFLEHLKDGALVITPGDRSDIILASLAADASATSPRVAGLLLTGGLDVSATLLELIRGLKHDKVPILRVPQDTFTTALEVAKVEAGLPSGGARKIAAALGAFEANVDIEDLRARVRVQRSSRVTPLMFEYELLQRAKRSQRRIVLPEGTDERVLQAAEIITLRGVAELVLLGDEKKVRRKIKALGLSLDAVEVIDPVDSPLRERFADTYAELRAHKGVSRELAWDVVTDVSYFGTLMVHLGLVDGMVSGAAHTTQHTIRPALEIVKTRPGVRLVSSVFFMCLPNRVLVYGDCAVNPNPDAEGLADIAIASAETAAQFGIEARVAMLSYSSGASGKGADVEKVRAAAELVRQRRPELLVDGPMQYDAAVDLGVARAKMPESPVAGRATVLVFPDLNTGNNTYKAVQRSAGAVAIGPVLQGLGQPINDLSRGCAVADIVNTIAITAIQRGPR